MIFKRVLLKLSGESLMGDLDYGIAPQRLSDYAEEISEARELGTEICVVIGGGNIFRGVQGAARGMDRVQGDYMGMLATTINSLALQAELNKQGVPTALLSSFEMGPVSELMSSKKAIQYLSEKKVVIVSGGTGNPYFTTDTASVLRALEVKAQIFLKGTRVDGVYDDDPEKNPQAVKFDELTFGEALQKKLKIMDLTAFALCEENRLPVYVFDMNTRGNLLKVLKGEKIGTLVKV